MGGSVRGRVWGKWGGWVVCVRAFLPPIISGQFGSRSKWNNKKKKKNGRPIDQCFVLSCCRYTIYSQTNRRSEARS